MNNHKFNTGQSLIEIVVAVGIIALVLVGVSDLITRSLSLSSFQSNKNKAVNIAQSQLTYYRQKRDLNPVDFFVDPQANYSTCVEISDPVKYVCTIVYQSVANGVNMIVSIDWKDGDKSITTQLSQFLYKPTK